MNAPENTLQQRPAPDAQDDPILVSMIKNLDKRGRMEIAELTGWQDDSSVSHCLSGKVGIPLQKLDAILKYFDLAIVERGYMDYLAKGNAIGANCCKARLSLGFCKTRQ